MHLCHETICQAPYVQGRRQERQRQPRFVVPMLMISDRPAEAAAQSVPGHWEGDLIIGKDSASQIGTIVEHASRYLLLIRLPADRDAETVPDDLAATMARPRKTVSSR
jgi:transposase, IS30 family